MRTTTVRELDQVSFLADTEKKNLLEPAYRFGFLSNDYYLSLIDWNDPADPSGGSLFPHSRKWRNGEGRMRPTKRIIRFCPEFNTNIRRRFYFWPAMSVVGFADIVSENVSFQLLETRP